MTFLTLRKTTIVLAAGLALAACGKDNQQQQQQQMPPPEVGVVKVTAQTVPLTRDLVGRLSATRTADVRARVAGVLQKRLYVEGTDVKEGQPLFQIDPAPLKATLNAQLANLASAQATYQNNKVAADRVRSIADKGLMSKTDRDNADAAERTAAAAVKQALANVDSARINLGYASVVAPIAGRSGKQQVTEGALVGQGEATLLTTVEQIDPIYVNFSQAVGEIEELRRAAATGSVALSTPGKARIELLRPDGSAYGTDGTLDFSDAAVDAATGAVNLRGIVANSDRALLPGFFVRVRVPIDQEKNGLFVPDVALGADQAGRYLLVVNADNVVEQRKVQAGPLDGGLRIINGGLKPDDRVVTAGLLRVIPGQKVEPQARAAEQHPASAR